MKVIIMGCGRTGSQISMLMDEHGHEVVVIDHDANAEDRLGPGFKGRLVKGVGFDRLVLVDSGIEQADAFVASSQSDNANIVAARIARNVFRVPRVVARLYDPRRAEIYQRLGLITISSTTWGAERIFQVLTHSDLDVRQTFGRGEVSLVYMEATPTLVGKNIMQLNVPGEVLVVAITRDDQAILPISGTEFRDGDIIHLAVLTAAMNRLEELLGLERR
ncbi:MAG: TrkA family potassium uptake protein [Anaerolineales bacterium]|nr:TrkA family potassium uptake protein [Anaerolineales bacterium]